MRRKQEIEWSKLTEEQLKIVNYYCDNNMKQLRKICDPILIKCNIPRMNYDDLYDVAVDTLGKSIETYNKQKSQFKTFLTGNLRRKFIQWMRDDTRGCRCNVLKDENGNIVKDEKNNNIPIQDISFDAPNDDGNDLAEIIDSGISIERECLSTHNSLMSENVKAFLKSLGGVQREIAKLLSEGYCDYEIKEKLHISDTDYYSCISDMRSYEKKKFLLREESELQDNIFEVIEEEKTTMGTSEKTKNTSYSLEAISKKLRKHRLRDDHILQRTSGQWNLKTKSELMSDILQGRALTQVIISEEIKNGIQMLWLIDGKQRCTNIDDFMHDGFAISKNIKIRNIEYQSDKLDEDGNVVLNEDGFPVPEKKVFDIGGKKFSQLPDELQDRFKEYQLPVMFNLNCTKMDIAYDISRFNRCRSMNVAQSGWTGFDEEYAELVDNILKMDFFKPDCKKTSYTKANITAGTLRRMLVESIVLSEFPDAYNSDFGKMCEYLTDNATENVFVDFYLHVERLVSVTREETAGMFNSKNSFLWFVLFNKFDKLSERYGIEDKRFYEFLCALQADLHSKKINGISFDSLDEETGTKKKPLIMKKLDLLETLLKDFLEIEAEEKNNIKEIEINQSAIDFVNANVYENPTEEDIKCYEEDLEVLTLDIDNNSPLLNPENYNSLIGIIAYSYKRDVALDDWFINFFNDHKTYIKNQKENYTYMKMDFDKYVDKVKSDRIGAA